MAGRNFSEAVQFGVVKSNLDEDFCTIETLQSQISRYQRKLNELKEKENLK